MRFLHGLVFDLLALALLLKLLWDAELRLLPRVMIVAAVVGDPFLLGIGGHSGLMSLRVGVGMASLALFLASHPLQTRSTYLIILAVSLLVYFWTRLARRTLSRFAAAFVVIILILYLLRIL